MWSQMSWRQINPPSVGRSMLDDCQSRSACRPVTGASKYVSVLSGSIASSSASSGPVSRSVEPGSPTRERVLGHRVVDHLRVPRREHGARRDQGGHQRDRDGLAAVVGEGPEEQPP